MARTPKLLRKKARSDRWNSLRHMGKGHRRRYRGYFLRATAKDARPACVGPARDRPRVRTGYETLMAGEARQGTLLTRVEKIRDPWFGWEWRVTAALGGCPPVPVRCEWSWGVKQGGTRRWAELFARALEAGLLFDEFLVRVDAYGDAYIASTHGYHGWAEYRGGESLYRHTIRLGAIFAGKGVYAGHGGCHV